MTCFSVFRFRNRNAAGRIAAILIAVFGILALDIESVGAQQSTNPADVLQQVQQRMSGVLGQDNSGQDLTQQQTILEPNAPPNPTLPRSRLEQLLSTRAGITLRQFGYDQLGVGRPVTLVQAGAAQDSYVLGPGDEIVVSLRGQENSDYRAVVDRDGRVVLPRLAPISASGRQFGDFRQDLANAIHRAYVATEGYVTLGRIRQISVLVSGEVNSPGVRIMTGLSTPVEALLISGGVKKSGSLRHVYILRGQRQIPVDLYSVLTSHGSSNIPTLAEGDRVVVPPLGPTVAVAGWVRRPGIYESASSRGEISVHDLLSLAGGLVVRGKYRFSVLRVAPDGSNRLETLNGESGIMGDSDILFVQPAANQTTSMATLSGGTPLAGRYPVAGTKLSEILKSPGALGTSPYTLIGLISRRDPVTQLRTLLPFTPVAVLKGSEDMNVQSDDVVRIISVKESRMLSETLRRYMDLKQSSEEALRNPRIPSVAGSPSEGQLAFSDRQALVRAERDELRAEQQNTMAKMAPGRYSQESKRLAQLDTGQANAPLGQVPASTQVSPDMAGQETEQSQDSPLLQSQQQIIQPLPQAGLSPEQQQMLLQQQQQQMTPPQPPSEEQNLAPNLEAQSQDPDQAESYEEVDRLSQLAGQLHVDALVLANFLEDHTVNVDGAVNGPGIYFVGQDADIQSVLAASGGMMRWADRTSVEVISTSVDPNTASSQTVRRTLSLANGADSAFVVSPQDNVHVNEVYTAVGIGSVKLQGQVRHTGTYQIVRGEHLSELLMRAGGLTDSAYPYGTVFLRRSAAERERDAFRREAEEIQDQLMLAMSRRDPNSKLSPEAFVALQRYVTQIRSQTPLGRVTIVADPAVLASDPTKDPLLEPGDVVFIPQRPYGVSVLGEVLQPGSVAFRPGMSAKDYIAMAGGYSKFADDSETILVLPDGSARRVDSSWLSFGSNDVPPGSTIFVARDVSGFDMHQLIIDTTQILSQLATSAAALAILSTQIK
ncbi:MAG: SLBB domain-containing protein [Alphaproteobacteria bacterium]|nr:SLBB domain-containing protein [Alphaproteobacteria bacterium]